MLEMFLDLMIDRLLSQPKSLWTYLAWSKLASAHRRGCRQLLTFHQQD